MKPKEAKQGVVLLPLRWLVERSFGGVFPFGCLLHNTP